MLVALQTAGSGAPLFIVHGVAGVTILSSTFTRALGSGNPLYVFHANGMHGTQPLFADMPDMVRAYVADIEQARPSGRIAVAGMCEGSLAVLEMARLLHEKGRQVGPVILIDPQPIPPGYDRRNFVVDVNDPAVASNLRRRVREAILRNAELPYNDIPFDTNDENQLEMAVSGGVASVIAFGRHVPRPYDGPTHLILSKERAGSFFQAQTPWQDLLRGSRTVHVLPFDHFELLRSGRELFARTLMFAATEPLDKVAEPQAAVG